MFLNELLIETLCVLKFNELREVGDKGCRCCIGAQLSAMAFSLYVVRRVSQMLKW